MAMKIAIAIEIGNGGHLPECWATIGSAGFPTQLRTSTNLLNISTNQQNVQSPLITIRALSAQKPRPPSNNIQMPTTATTRKSFHV